MNIDLTKIYEEYKGKWIAFNESSDKVVSFDRTAKGAYKKAQKLGYKCPTLFKVPQENLPYFG